MKTSEAIMLLAAINDQAMDTNKIEEILREYQQDEIDEFYVPGLIGRYQFLRGLERGQ